MKWTGRKICPTVSALSVKSGRKRSKKEKTNACRIFKSLERSIEP